MNTCPQCGAQVGDTDDFCGNCGNYLGWGAKPATGPDGTAGEPVAAPEHVPAPEQLGPVLPGRPEARRPLPTAPGGVTVQGPACPTCGTANPPDRRFCRSCATPLNPEQQPVAVRRRRRWRWRGDRSRWLRRLVALLVVAALVVAAILFFPQATALWEDLRDRLATPAPVAVEQATASASVPGHPPSGAVDTLTNHYWGTTGTGQSIDFTFAAPFRLLSVVVHTGASAEEDGFAAQARPSTLDMVVSTEDGATHTVPITLADEPGPQTTDTGISDVVRIRLVVRGVAGLSPGRHVALGEVEFFRRP
ncbi:NADase-type glycan-binding domain-containing protein [Actinophytocola sediminis]